MSIKHKMDLKAKTVAMAMAQQVSSCALPKDSAGGKFEQHHYDIFRDILDFVIYFCTDAICDVVNF